MGRADKGVGRHGRRIAANTAAALCALLAAWTSVGARAQPRPPSTAVDCRAMAPAEALARAHQAFAARDYVRAGDWAACVGAADGAAAEARLVGGYAAFKRGDLPRAAALLDASLARGERRDAAFLRGLVAEAMHDGASALRFLRPVATDRESPLAATARRLVRRIEAALARARDQEDARRRAATHARALAALNAALRAGRTQEAWSALRQAEQARPQDALNDYYRGYLAYQRGAYRQAELAFRAALALAPRDGWSHYMLALTLRQRGQPQPARALLAGLADRGREGELREAARLQLAVERPARHVGNAVLATEVATGAGVDSNPAFRTETTPSDSLALCLEGRALVWGRVPLARRHALSAGLRIFARDYAWRGEGQAATDVAAWVGDEWQGQRLGLGLDYSYQFSLYGYRPLLSLHDLALSLWLPLTSRLSVQAISRLDLQQAHDGSYGYLDGLSLSGQLGGSLAWSRAVLRLGYSVLHNWADPTRTVLAVGPRPGGSGAVTYRSDYTHLAHGPRAELRLALPGRLTLSATGELLWYRFSAADQLVDEAIGSTPWSAVRADLRFLAGTELSRPLGRGLELAAFYQSIDNLSSLDGATPLPRSYSRRLAGLLLRWRWPGS